MNDTIHRIMAQKRIFRAGTETPISLVGHTTEARYRNTVGLLRNAWENKVPITFSTDADYCVPGKTPRRSCATVYRTLPLRLGG